MTGFSARRLASALAVTAVSAFAFASTASSAFAETEIKGQGSTLQEDAQIKHFIPAFNAKKVEEGGIVSEYHPTGSGPGLEAWGNGGHKAEFNTWEYVGTDQPPNAAQKAAIEAAAGGAKVLSIPTIQAATAVAVNLPAGCTSATNSYAKAPGRLVLNNVTLEGIFAHTITKWSQIKDDGDKLLPEGCEGASEITRVVRTEGSGTTAIFKKYLYQINQAPVDGAKNWNNLAEENKNLNWPAETENLVRGAGNGGMVTTVAATPGSIGYINLANAYSTFKGSGGSKFWAFLQDNGVGTTGGKYANPEEEKTGNKVLGENGKPVKPTQYTEGTSNCKSVKYVNGVGAKFPPASTEEAWNEVSSSTKESKYSLCGFTYDLSLVGFTSIEPSLQPTAAQVELVKKYFTFMLSPAGQATVGGGSDYFGLPSSGNASKSVLAIAQAGAAKSANDAVTPACTVVVPGA